MVPRTLTSDRDRHYRTEKSVRIKKETAGRDYGCDAHTGLGRHVPGWVPGVACCALHPRLSHAGPSALAITAKRVFADEAIGPVADICRLRGSRLGRCAKIGRWSFAWLELFETLFPNQSNTAPHQQTKEDSREGNTEER